MGGPALQCPECRKKHPVDDIPAGTRLFRCRSCSRVLKVPTALLDLRGEAGAPVPTGAGLRPSGQPGVPAVPGQGGSDATSAISPTPSPAPTAPPAAPRRTARSGPRAAFRAVVWLVSLIAGLGMSVMPLLLVGFLDIDRVFDVFSGEGFDRVKLPLVLIPLWAGVAATFAHLAIEARARSLDRRATASPGDLGRGGSSVEAPALSRASSP